MPIFFFSFDNNEDKNSSGIKALTGLKSIVIPEKRLPFDIEEFMSDGKEQTEAYLTNSLIDFFNRQGVPDDFKEEWTHYSCISRSKIASYLFLRNFLTRNTYSSYFRNIIPKAHPPSISHTTNILDYLYEHIIYHYVSYPWIEAQYFINIEGMPILPFRAQEYRIVKYMELLLKMRKDLEPSTIAHLIDNDYSMFWKYGYRSFSNYEESLTLREVDNLAFGMFFSLNVLINVFLDYRAYASLNRTSVRHIRNTVMFMINRFFKSKGIADSTSFMPGILSGRYTVDPKGFPIGKKALESHEKEFFSKTDKAKADLFWHITNRAIFVKYLSDTNLNQDEIYSYFFFLNNFFAEWRPEVSNILDKLFFVDDSIILPILAIKGNLFINKESVFCSLIDIIYRIYKESVNEYEYELANPNSGFPAALNCSYMHI